MGTATGLSNTQALALLNAKAPLASPTFTGTPAVPTATAGTNTTQAASTAFVAAALAALINASPSQLDTIRELADAIGDDANFAATVTAALGKRVQSWSANTAYTNGQIIIGPDGSVLQATTGFTSGSTFSASNWTTLIRSGASVGSDGTILNAVKVTQAQYDAINPKPATTLFVIVG